MGFIYHTVGGIYVSFSPLSLEHQPKPTADINLEYKSENFPLGHPTACETSQLLNLRLGLNMIDGQEYMKSRHRARCGVVDFFGDGGLH